MTVTVNHSLPPRNLKRCRLAQHDVHTIAKLLDAQYEGDVNALDHGGFFYTFDDAEHGYVCAVELEDPADWGHDGVKDTTRYIAAGSINLPSYRDTAKWEKLVRSIQEEFNTEEITRELVVYYLKGQWGIERDTEWFIDTKRWTDNMVYNLVAKWLGRDGAK